MSSPELTSEIAPETAPETAPKTVRETASTSAVRPDPDPVYPDSDGNPMADNTKQFRWIVVIEQNLEWIYADDPDTFVAGDLLWYPVEGRPDIRIAPDALVVFGRPKGDRGSYRQWQEENVPPQVVFEVLSPGNRPAEMARKLLFYEEYGVEEYYVFDPDRLRLAGFLRGAGGFGEIAEMSGWISPRLGIRFELTEDDLHLFRPDGRPFHSFAEVNRLVEDERQRAETERQRAETERQRAEDTERRLAEMEAQLQQYRDRFGDLPPGDRASQ